MAPLPRPPPCDPNAEWPIPKLTIRCDDLAHPGAKLFFQHVNPYEALREAVIAVYCWLYTPETVPRKYVILLALAIYLDRQSSESNHYRVPVVSIYG